MPRRKKIEEEVAVLPPKRKKTAAFMAGLVVMCFVVTGAAIFIGSSDEGQINVSSVIQNTNQARMDAGQEPLEAVGEGTDNYKNMPNGGLVAQEGQPATPPLPETPAVDPNATTTETTDAEGEDTSTNTQTDASAGDTAVTEDAEESVQ